MKGNPNFVNEVSLKAATLSVLREAVTPRVSVFDAVPGDLRVFDGLLSAKQVSTLYDDVQSQAWIPVGLDGIKSHHKEGDKIGSWRLSCFEPDWAESLFEKLKAQMGEIFHFDGQNTENAPFEKWRFTGVNPLLRFIKYEQNGLLIPHYDRSFIQGEKRSLMSLVLYLTPTNVGLGRTRFLRDERAGVPVAERDLSDREAVARESDVVCAPCAKPGDAAVFEHCVLHDSEEFSGAEPKIIARTDLVFEPC